MVWRQSVSVSVVCDTSGKVCLLICVKQLEIKSINFAPVMCVCVCVCVCP